MKLHCGTLLQGRGQRAELSPSFSRPIDIVVSKHLNITRVLKTDIRTREDLLWTWGHCPYRGICPLYSVDSSPLHTYNPSRPCASTWRNELAGWKVFPYFNLSRIAVHVVQGMNILRTTWFGGASLSSHMRKVVAGGAVLPVILGLWTLSREPLMALSSTVECYSACFMVLGVYRI